MLARGRRREIGGTGRREFRARRVLKACLHGACFLLARTLRPTPLPVQTGLSTALGKSLEPCLDLHYLLTIKEPRH